MAQPMTHDDGALAFSNLDQPQAPLSAVTVLPPSSQDDDEWADESPSTKRFNAFDLATALAAMDHVDELEDDELTLALGANDRGTFSTVPSNGPRPRGDDDPTLDVPSPPIPADLPSPLGNEETAIVARGRAKKVLEETLTLRHLGVDRDEEPLLANAPSIAPDTCRPSTPGSMAQVEPLALAGVVPANDVPASEARIASTGRMHERFISPEEVTAARLTRQALRDARAAEQQTRALVLAIWTIAVAMAVLLTYILATS